VICPSCRADVPAGARFCPSCGQDLRLRGDERRVVTVLFADLVGFTGMAEARDPEQVKNIVDRCFQRLVRDIEAYGGRVDKIIGDAVVALFGAPLAHEDDAERAVRAGLQMQQTLGRSVADLGVEVRMRIGVNTGEVLVGSLRAGGDYTAMGDVVNTASRLQAAAQPGQVLVGAATHAATHRVILYQPMGDILAKGREEPVPAWVAVEAMLPPGYRPDRDRSPLVGRDAELAVLGQAARLAVLNQRAALLLVLGEAGVGKSRLAEELARHVRDEHRALVLEGRCVPYGEASLWWPIADALRHACGIGTDDPEDLAVERARATVRDALGHGGPAAGGVEAGGDEVDHVLAGLLHLMGYDSPLRAIDPTRAREEATAAVVTFVERATEHRPVVVGLSDLHWADDAVLALLDRLLDRLGSRRFVLLATARTRLEDRWTPPTGRHNQITLTLDPLGVDAAQRMLEALLGAPPPPELAAAVLERSGGNPLFLEELVALLAESGVVGTTRGDDAVLHEALARNDLPDTLRGLVAARLDGVSTPERRVLECCAILGRSGPVSAVTTMAGHYVDPAEVGPAMDELVAKELLVVDGATDDASWSFRSDLVREVAYGTLTKGDRARGHAGIAMWMERHEDLGHGGKLDVITHHWTRAAEVVAELGVVDGVPADAADRALHWIERAASRAEADEEPVVAARLYGEGLALLHEGADDRHRVLVLGRGRALAALRDLTPARESAEVALREALAAGDGQCEARALLVLADVAQKEARWDEADRLLVRATAGFEEAGDVLGEAEGLRLRGFGAMFRGDHSVASELLESARHRFAEAGDRRGEAWALQNLAWCSFYDGRVQEAESRLRIAIEFFSDLGDRGGKGWALGLLAYARFIQGHLDEAEELAETVRVHSQERGDEWGHGMMLVLTASVHLWTGRTCSAVDRATEAAEIFDRIGDAYGRVQAGAVRGRALVCSGRVEEGLAELAALDQVTVTDRDRTLWQVARLGTHVQLGDVAGAAEALGGADRAVASDEDAVGGESAISVALHLLQRGDVDAALQVLAIAGAGPAGRRSGYLAAVLALARAASGDLDAVGPLADEVDQAQGATYLDRVIAELARSMAAVAAGDRAAAATAARRAVAAADATEDRVAAALARLGAGLAASGGAPPGVDGDGEPVADDDLGISTSGWATALGLAAGADPRPRAAATG
jgi:class 3 adenylate cyclase/tetratricopeptide (TPR) repeat protein